jgi:hypothetical protein
MDAKEKKRAKETMSHLHQAESLHQSAKTSDTWKSMDGEDGGYR